MWLCNQWWVWLWSLKLQYSGKVGAYAISTPSVSPTICMSITACIQDNHAHPVAPNGEKDHFRHCSSPEVINCYLTKISGEISILTACSKICMCCYRFFNETTKQLAQVKSGDQISHETQRCQGFIRTRSKICLDQE